MIKLKSILLEGVYEYFYHATTPNALPNIVKHGLLPSKNPNWGGALGDSSIGKIFVTNKFKRANYYGNVIWRNNPKRYRPILRFKYNKLGLVPDKHSADDFYVESPLKTEFEVFVYNDTTKIDRDKFGDDMRFHEETGNWRVLTKDIADSIVTGEWDAEPAGELNEVIGDCPRCMGWGHLYLRAGIPNLTQKCPRCKGTSQDPKNPLKMLTVYQGQSAHNKGSQYYSPSKEFARNFTQSGLDKEIKRVKIADEDVYRAKTLPSGTNDSQLKRAEEEAKAGHFKALWVDEGQNNPPSIYVFDRKIIQ